MPNGTQAKHGPSHDTRVTTVLHLHCLKLKPRLRQNNLTSANSVSFLLISLK